MANRSPGGAVAATDRRPSHPIVLSLRDPAAYDRMQMGWLDPDGAIGRDTLRYDLEYFRQQGYYSGSVTFDDIIDTSFAEYAAQQLGPYR